MKELVRLFETFDSDSIPLVFLDMNLDTSTSQGRLLRHILAAFAEYESDVKADYTRANHRRIRAEGRPWGIAPFGYRKGAVPATWVIDKPAAAIVRGAFESYARGGSANSIARSLSLHTRTFVVTGGAHDVHDRDLRTRLEFGITTLTGSPHLSVGSWTVIPPQHR